MVKIAFNALQLAIGIGVETTMRPNLSTKVVSFLLTSCVLVMLLVVGVSIQDKRSAKDDGASIDVFNERLVAYNRDVYLENLGDGNENAVEANNPSDSSSTEFGGDQLVGESESNSDTKNSTLNDDQFDGVVKPFNGQFSSVPENPAFDWLDPSLSINAIVEASQERGQDEDTYAWIQFRSDVKASELQRLTAELGVEVVSSSPKYARVKLPADRDMLSQLAELSEVEGFGLMPNEAKTPAHLMDAFDNQSLGTEVPVFITTMNDDVDGSMRERLIAMGATVGQWDPDIRTYYANVDRMTLDSVLAADFVEKVSPNALLRAHLADLTGTMGADLHRTFNEADHSWSGHDGAGATIGVMDTGINTHHREFSDKSVCTRSTDHTSRNGAMEARIDPHGHGSHVSGIAAASGITDPSYAGVASGSKALRVAKVLTNAGGGDTLMYFNGVNFHTETDPCDDPATADPAHVINVSLGGFTPETDGTSIISRKMDSASYHFRQNYVISAGNDGRLGADDTSSTKSAMPVGAATDSGVIASFSSHGPTLDGRLMPHIAAPGFQVWSALGRGRESTYGVSSGTSMSSPAVAGLVGVLIGANPELADNPAAVRASLMAAAIKPRRWIGSMENMPKSNTRGPGYIQNEYGMGFASLAPHGLDDVDHGVIHGEMNSDGMASTMITVPEGTARLDIVMAFNEPASPALNRTVLSNLDLYLDRDANCGGGACGEYSSKSEIDTVEWILIKDPAPGDYELKVLPANAFDSPALFGAAWVMIEDDLPELSITSDTTSVILDKGDRFEIDLNVGASGYVANGVTVHVMCRANLIPAEEEGADDKNPCDAYSGATVGWLPGSVVSRGDGTTKDLTGQPFNRFSFPIPVGAVTAESGKDLTLKLSGTPVGEVGAHTLYFVATSWNGMSDHHAVNVVVGDDADLPPRAMPPANDDIDNAIALTGEKGVLQPDLILATRESGEPMLRDSFATALIKFPISSDDNLDYALFEDIEYVFHNSVWYTVDSQDKPALLLLSGIPGNVGVNVFKGEAAKGAMVADNWNVASTVGADGMIAVNMEPNARYYVQIYAHEDVHDLKILWAVGDPKPPANDHFANAQVVDGDVGRVSGTNFKASLEGFETFDSTFAFSTWYSWSPTTDGAFMFEVDGEARIAVLSGSTPANLRRVSTVPDYGDHIYTYAVANETYHIVLLSRASQDTLSGYWLEWNKVDAAAVKDHSANDMFANAETAIDSISDSWLLGRTVEPGEPSGSGVATNWWKWTATTTGSYTFVSDAVAGDFISVFTGSNLGDLALQASGSEFILNAVAGTEYYIAIGRSTETMYVDYLYLGIPSAEVAWGPTPANDSRTNAMALMGGAGTADYTHAFATTEASDGLLLGLSHSLWWEWTAGESGWVQFATDSDPALSYTRRSVDSIVVVYDPNTGRRIGTSDRSYLLNGNAEITFYADAGRTYPIQTVLRIAGSNIPTGQTSITWGPADAPPYSRFVGQYRAADVDPSREVTILEDPTSIATNEGGGKIFVNAANGLAVFDAVAVDTMPTLTKEVAYPVTDEDEDEESVGLDEALLHWDNAMDVLYAITPEAIWMANYDGDNAHFAQCAPTDVSYLSITDAFTTADGNFLYVLGLEKLPPGVVPNPFVGPFQGYLLAIYSRDAADACALTHVQTEDQNSISALETTFSFAASADGSHVYLAGDDGVTALSRNATTGALTEVGFSSVFLRAGFSGYWRDSEAVLAPLTEDFLFITAEDSPTVAAYSLADPANPALIDSTWQYYFRVGSLTFEAAPSWRFGCRQIGGHATAAAVDFMCRGELLTAELQESGQIWLMDAMYWNGDDRFGRKLSNVRFAPDGPKNVGVRPLSQNLFLLNSGTVDSMAVFDHVIQIEGNPYD